MSIENATIELDQNHFVVHLDNRDLLIAIDLIQEVTQLPILPHHAAPMDLIDYMPFMGIWCTEMDQGLRASTTFHNVRDIGRWI